MDWGFLQTRSSICWLIGEYSKGGRGGDNEQEGHTGFLVLSFAVPSLLVVTPPMSC